MKGRALIAMSGGVDSSVAAALMQESGYECIGVTMKLFSKEAAGDSGQKDGVHPEDTEDARAVANKLGIRFDVCNFTEDFTGCVLERFVHAYETGKTPNPCIYCNRYIKFGKLFQYAKELSCDVLVTGHYARTAYDGKLSRWQLKRGVNRAKDQSYVLCFMTQEQLAHTIFPLGEFEGKDQVREIAHRYGLTNASRHDSQDICFVPDGDYAGFIERYTGKKYPGGDFVSPEGRVLGQHKGIIRYTIGQRKGLGLALPAPLYVRKKDVEKNQVILAPEKDLYSRTLTAYDFNWISREAPRPGETIRVTAKPRYRAKEAEAEARVQEDGSVVVVFDEPQRAITTGQTVVLYDGELVVGGGIIS